MARGGIGAGGCEVGGDSGGGGGGRKGLVEVNDVRVGLVAVAGRGCVLGATTGRVWRRGLDCCEGCG